MWNAKPQLASAGDAACDQTIVDSNNLIEVDKASLAFMYLFAKDQDLVKKDQKNNPDVMSPIGKELVYDWNKVLYQHLQYINAAERFTNLNFHSSDADIPYQYPVYLTYYAMSGDSDSTLLHKGANPYKPILDGPPNSWSMRYDFDAGRDMENLGSYLLVYHYDHPESHTYVNPETLKCTESDISLESTAQCGFDDAQAMANTLAWYWYHPVLYAVPSFDQ